MVFRMKNFNIFGVHWKIWLLRGGGSQKANIEGGGLGLFADLRGGGLGKKEGVVFLRGGVETPMHTMCSL